MSNNEEYEAFLSLNNNLIDEISNLINMSLNFNISNQGRLVSIKDEHYKINAIKVKEHLLPILSNLIKNYEKNAPILAKYQLGLSKFLDYYSFDWLDDEDHKNLDNLVKQIVHDAYKISKQVSNIVVWPCDNKHDDRACEKKLLGSRYYNNGIDVTYKNWPDLPAKDAINFLRKPMYKTLLPNTRLIRIIRNNVNSLDGSWWINDTELPLKSKKYWRANYAVLENWNIDNDYIAIIIPNHLNAWVGAAASQQARDNCILSGGKEQVWISQSDSKYLVENHSKLYMSFRWPLR